jgi:hypothetical protein
VVDSRAFIFIMKRELAFRLVGNGMNSKRRIQAIGAI